MTAYNFNHESDFHRMLKSRDAEIVRLRAEIGKLYGRLRNQKVVVALDAVIIKGVVEESWGYRLVASPALSVGAFHGDP